jgi:hypothetical protein
VERVTTGSDCEQLACCCTHSTPVRSERQLIEPLLASPTAHQNISATGSVWAISVGLKPDRAVIDRQVTRINREPAPTPSLAAEAPVAAGAAASSPAPPSSACLGARPRISPGCMNADTCLVLLTRDQLSENDAEISLTRGASYEPPALPWDTYLVSGGIWPLALRPYLITNCARHECPDDDGFQCSGRERIEPSWVFIVSG